MMNRLLWLSRLIDGLNARVGRLASWLVLAAVLISAGNAVTRKALNLSSNAALEIQWYLFSGVFLLCAGATLLANEHVRVDVILSRLSRRKQLVVEMAGTVFFLMPVTVLILVLSWPSFVTAYVEGEMSSNAGGLIRWPVKLLIPVGFALLLLQGVSQFIKSADEYRRLRAGGPPGATRQGARP